jgi:hypothetical protein
MKTAGLVAAATFLTLGCTPTRRVTRQEWVAMSSRVFKNTTVDAVLENAEKVLRLDDPSDVQINHPALFTLTEGGMQGTFGTCTRAPMASRRRAAGSSERGR